MHTHLRATQLSVLFLSIFCASSHAATISLVPSNPTTIVGNSVTLDLHMNFTGDATVGGGVDIFYDSNLLSYQTFEFSPALGDDVAFRNLPTILPSQLNGLSFGNFGGLTGPGLVGTFTFNTLAVGTANLTMANNDRPFGGFISAITGASQAVVYQGTTVSIAPVPLPAAVWLLFSALGALGIPLLTPRCGT